jgi:hypothetical protein
VYDHEPAGGTSEAGVPDPDPGRAGSRRTDLNYEPRAYWYLTEIPAGKMLVTDDIPSMHHFPGKNGNMSGKVKNGGWNIGLAGGSVHFRNSRDAVESAREYNKRRTQYPGFWWIKAYPELQPALRALE